MVLIRKYGNRRLYDTRSSRYVNLDDLAILIRAGEELKVVDAKTEEDLTREVLLQVVMEVQGGLDFLPTPLLRRIIRATGDEPAQRLLRQQLASAFDLLHTQLERVESQFSTMFPAFFHPLRPGGMPGTPTPGATPPPAAPPPAAPPQEPPDDAPPQASPAADRPPADRPPEDDDLAALRSRLESLEKRLRRP
jgi:polyhydroxyalkanoate synthesis repressor PhaR